MMAGVWTRLFAFVALVMIVNFYIASGAISTFAFLTNPYGLPVLGGTLALAIGGMRLPLESQKLKVKASQAAIVPLRSFKLLSVPVDPSRPRGRPSRRRTSCARD